MRKKATFEEIHQAFVESGLWKNLAKRYPGMTSEEALRKGLDSLIKKGLVKKNEPKKK